VEKAHKIMYNGNMRAIKHIIPKVETTIKRYNMFSQGEKILVAVSGGPDSVALLYVLYELREKYQLNLGIVHFEHGIRGKASLEDAKFVEKLANELDLPFYLGQGKVREFAKEKKICLEAAARELRYRFFEEIIEKQGFDKVALGHTADDQVEEVLRRFIRGTSWVGLAGMPPVRGRYIRPLIEVTRREIEEALKESQISYRIDETNEDLRFYRNRIRHKLIPIMSEFNPRFKQGVLEMAEIWREEDAFLRKLAEAAYKDSVMEKDGGLALDLKKFSRYQLVLQRRVLCEVLKSLSISYTRRHINVLLRWASPGGVHKRFSLPKGWWAYKEGERLLFTRKIDNCPEYRYLVFSPQDTYIEEVKTLFKMQIKMGSLRDIDFSPKKAYINLGKCKFPIEIRPFKAGDRFWPLNSKGFKKVKDFFIDKKIPYSLRREYPVFVSGGEIIWIAGLRLDERVKLDENICKYLLIEMVKDEDKSNL